MTAIRTTSLTKRYSGGLFRGSTVTAVDELDLVVEDGEVYGFLGPNGAGKSTTIDMLLDYSRPTEGTAKVLGHDVQAEPEAVSERVGVLPEGYGLYDRLTGRRNLEFAIEWQGADDDPTALLERVGLASDDAARKVGGYSKGMTQRLALAMALAGDPDLLVLDEPSSGLDPNGIRMLREIVREEANRGTSVFFSSHILGQVEAVCDRIGILDDGELVAVDTVDGLREAAGSSSTLELTMGKSPTTDIIDVDGIEDIEVRGNRLRMTCTDPRAKAHIVAKLVDNGHEVVDIGSESASLEEIFAVYTNDEAETESSRGDNADQPADETEEMVA